MAASRSLPERRNPLLEPEHTPQLEILVERRKLGQTDLSVKPGQVGTSNATQPKNLGPFDYAHLRVPLPKDLKGSGIFQGTKSAPIPEAYFLMRRSSDGYVSATGMFKAAFPWASKQEEDSEREYLKSFDTTDPAEVAGNVWVRESFAIELAEEYGIGPWIEALLDPEDVDIGPAVNPNKHIATPPKFNMPKNRNLDIGDRSARKRTTSRELRSASPTKKPAPASVAIKDRPKATPRKPRAKKNPTLMDAKPSRETRATSAIANELPSSSIADSVADSGEEADVDAETEAIADDVEAAVDEAKEDADEKEEEEDAQDEEVEEIEEAEADEPLPENMVRVSVQADVTDDGETETTRTTVRVEMPADAPELALPQDASEMVEKARAIVERAKELQDQQSNDSIKPATSQSRKRKADEYEEDLVLELDANEELVEVTSAEGPVSSQPPAKKLRVMVPAEEYRREKVTKRAFLALSFSLAFGVMVPTISAYLGY